MNKNLTIRNSTAEFLIFTTSNRQNTIEVKVEDESVWLTQKLIAKFFDIQIATEFYNTDKKTQKIVLDNLQIDLDKMAKLKQDLKNYKKKIGAKNDNLQSKLFR